MARGGSLSDEDEEAPFVFLESPFVVAEEDLPFVVVVVVVVGGWPSRTSSSTRRRRAGKVVTSPERSSVSAWFWIAVGQLEVFELRAWRRASWILGGESVSKTACFFGCLYGGKHALCDVPIFEQDGVDLRSQVGVERRGGVVCGRGRHLDGCGWSLRHGGCDMRARAADIQKVSREKVFVDPEALRLSKARRVDRRRKCIWSRDANGWC